MPEKEISLSKSVMARYIRLFDSKNIELNYNQYWALAEKQNFKFWNRFFLDEIKFRESHFSNLVFSVEGTQGEGKSLFLLRCGELISDVYGTKMSLDHVHFFQENMKQDLANFKERTFYAQDEQPRTHGIMSNFIQDELANYEDTYRKPQVNIGYASPSLRSHEHFFIFEALGDIYIDPKTGELSAVEVMLKTKRKSDNMIMPRGILRVSAPDKDLWKRYNEKKDEFIKKMGGSKGDRLKILEDYAIATIEQFGDKMIIETNRGEKIAPKTTIDFYMSRAIGLDNLTNDGRALVREYIKEGMIKKLM